MEIESYIYDLCSPYIAKKVILEYCRAKEGKYLVQKKTSQTYSAIYKDSKDGDTKERLVNMDLFTCSCLRITYYGFCCSHIFAVLLFNEENLLNWLPNLIEDRWKINTDLSYPAMQESSSIQLKIFKTSVKKKVLNTKTQKENHIPIKITKENPIEPLLSNNFPFLIQSSIS